MEILLLHPGALGDTILSLPAIVVLREAFPGARLTLAGNLDHLAPVVGTYVESVLSLSTLPLHNLFAAGALPDSDARFWNSYDRIISWTGSGDAGFVRRMQEIHPHACVASWRPGPQEQRHVSQIFVDSLGQEIAAGKKASPVPIRLDPGTLDEGSHWLSGQKRQPGEPLIALHAGAGSEAKRWPLARFAGLARRLVVEERNQLLLIEGPAEPGLAAQVAQSLPDGEAIRAESLPLALLAAVMAQCCGFVGNDSGIAHLAAALGIPSIVIFGPTIPRHWAPLGPNVAVVRDSRNCPACSGSEDGHSCLENIPVERVIRLLQEDRQI